MSAETHYFDTLEDTMAFMLADMEGRLDTDPPTYATYEIDLCAKTEPHKASVTITPKPLA